MRSVKKKKLSQVLHVVDPNLNIISPHKKKRRTTKADWDKLGGVTCPTCGRELLKTNGPLRQCRECQVKMKDIMLEETACPRCSGMAVKATAFSGGLMDVKVICHRCGTSTI